MGYYSQKLSAERLQLCYEIAPSRVKQYLEAEIEFVLTKINSHDSILELGCGYGRVLQQIMRKARTGFGIDTSLDSLWLARRIIGKISSCHLIQMNAIALGFKDHLFDVTICIQNGISAFKVDPLKLIEEAMRVTRIGGFVLFSSYSKKFWEDRLGWFRIQAEYGLVGEIDEDATKDGIIICKDGFKAITYDANDFIELTSHFRITPNIIEVDGSSIFCEIGVAKI